MVSPDGFVDGEGRYPQMRTSPYHFAKNGFASCSAVGRDIGVKHSDNPAASPGNDRNAHEAAGYQGHSDRLVMAELGSPRAGLEPVAAWRTYSCFQRCRPHDKPAR